MSLSLQLTHVHVEIGVFQHQRFFMAPTSFVCKVISHESDLGSTVLIHVPEKCADNTDVPGSDITYFF